MKRITHFLLVLAFFISAAPSLFIGMPAAGAVEAVATVEPPPPSVIFLPMVNRSEPTYKVSGRVIDSKNQPMAAVTITDNQGRSTVTDSQGNYTLSGLKSGDYAVAPARSGFVFSPSMLSGDLPDQATDRNFTAIQACSDVITNGSFESDTGWDFPVTPYPASYSTAVVHTGTRSARTGIVDPAAKNVYSYSSARTKTITIPADAGSATLRLWLYPISNDVANAPVAAAPTGPDFGNEALAYDAQYVLVLKPGATLADDTLLETLLWVRSNNQVWTFHEFNLSKYAGQTIKIQAGTYNDGYDGRTGMYVDDVALEICDGAVVPPTPTPTPIPSGCANYLDNSGFEFTRSWGIPVTEYSASYSTDRAYTGTRSMRTGIINAAYNKYSYSDAYQLVAVPAGATSIQVNMWIFPSSSEVSNAPMEEPKVGELFGTQPLASDAQYVLLLNQYGYLEQVLLWQRSNAQAWTNVVLNINASKYAGQTIRIQFGTYNDGYGGITSMYVDDAMLNVCAGTAPTPTPGPTPVPTATPVPGTCSERVGNGSFETTADWYIPITEFSAAYTTDQAHTGTRSMRTGIPFAAYNRYSYSDAGQAVSIPANTTSATLGLWVYPVSTEVTNQALPSSQPTGGLFGTEAMANDVQYVLILDAYGNWVDTLLWQRSNAQAWTYHQFDLTKYAGYTIRVQFGTYNDGLGGVTSMYVDDVSLQACP